MGDQWILVDATSKALVSNDIYDDEPTPADGQEVRLVIPGYPADWIWDPALDGFVPKRSGNLITVGRFLTLLTLPEMAAIHTAAKTDAQVEALLFMLQGFTQGISLSDPTLAAFLQVMSVKGLLSTERVAEILAGQLPG